MTLKAGILTCSLTELAEMYELELKNYTPKQLLAADGQIGIIDQADLYQSAENLLRQAGEVVGAEFIANMKYHPMSPADGVVQYIASAIALVPK
ncbi:hypothetical protein COV20_06005 [Candidatus Woesearchaeota archaeon CG10_big_fil_rev_8_21_14_0_10_45_16]|nr:MAG: hypothetical protein COV20_06005 [Candidatus Woesearchaeota archaeon CG10_big_fil_rev_8_21_14_0_10_45_16]